MAKGGKPILCILCGMGGGTLVKERDGKYAHDPKQGCPKRPVELKPVASDDPLIELLKAERKATGR